MKPGMNRLWVSASLLLFGCGGPSGIETAVVRGTVTLDGKPYTEGGTIFFRPEGGGKMARGFVEGDGTYVLTTYSPGDGAVVGQHHVQFLALPPRNEDETVDTNPSKATNSSNLKKPTLALPQSTCEVRSGQQNEFPIELKSQ